MVEFLNSIIFKIMSPTATKNSDTKDDVKISKSEKRKKSETSSKAEKDTSSKVAEAGEDGQHL